MKEPFDKPPRVKTEQIKELLKQQEQENKQKERQQLMQKKRKTFGRIKEVWYGALPSLLLICIPVLLSFLLWLLFNWNDALKLIEFVKEVGLWNCLFMGICATLCAIGSFNVFVAIIHMLEIIGNKLRPTWFYVYLITTVLGFFASIYLIILRFAK